MGSHIGNGQSITVEAQYGCILCLWAALPISNPRIRMYVEHGIVEHAGRQTAR